MPKMSSTCFTFVFNQGESRIHEILSSKYTRDFPGLTYRSAHFVFAYGNPWKDVINKLIMRNYAAIDSVYRRYFVVRLSFESIEKN